MLVGWEIHRDEYTGEFMPRIFSISPPRTGKVTYVFTFNLYSTIPQYQELTRRIIDEPQLRTNMREYYLLEAPYYTATFTANTCGYAEPRAGINWPSWDIVCLILFPVDWENLGEDPPLLVGTGTRASTLSAGGRGGVFGVAPALSVQSSPPARIGARPGSKIDVASVIAMGQTGATLRSTLSNLASGEQSVKVSPLNKGEKADLAGSLQMPALLPYENIPLEFRHSLEMCDIDRYPRTDSARSMVRKELAQYSPGDLVQSVSLEPTDCLLADTASGTFQVLGDNVSYQGMALSSAGPAMLQGVAPAVLTFSDLKFLRLEFSKSIALCEDRSLVSDGADSYDYSIFPLLRLATAARKVATNYRPARPDEGPPLPRALAGRPALR